MESSKNLKSEDDHLEENLNNILENMLNYLQSQQLQSSDDLNKLQSILKDYKNNLQLSQILLEASDFFIEFIKQTKNVYQFQLPKKSQRYESPQIQNENYDNLEKQMQKYEQDIRNHISLELQMKIQNEDLIEQLSKIEKENEQLKTKCDDQKDIIVKLEKSQLEFQKNIQFLQEKIKMVSMRQSNHQHNQSLDGFNIQKNNTLRTSVENMQLKNTKLKQPLTKYNITKQQQIQMNQLNFSQNLNTQINNYNISHKPSNNTVQGAQNIKTRSKTNHGPSVVQKPLMQKPTENMKSYIKSKSNIYTQYK